MSTSQHSVTLTVQGISDSPVPAAGQGAQAGPQASSSSDCKTPGLPLAPVVATTTTENKRFVNRGQSSDLIKSKRHLSSDSEEEVAKLKKIDHVKTPSGPVPLFLTVKHKEEGHSLAKTSPFLINKSFVGAGGQPASIKKLRNGTLLVEAVNEIQARKFLRLSSFFDQVEVKVEPHATLNSSKGVVYSRDLLDVSLEEIKEELASELVTDVVRIMKKENGVLVPTAGLILTFAAPLPPSSLKVGYISLPVKPYFKNPQRCFKCQRYGHSSQVCTNSVICCRCGQSGHDDKDCTEEEHCANCKGKHMASSRNCKTYTEEKEILKITTLEKLPFAEARKEFKRRQGTPPKQDQSYSQAVAKPVQQPTQCSSCTVLEGMVRALTEQVATLVHQLGKVLNQSVVQPVQPAARPQQALARPTINKTAPVQKTVTPLRAEKSATARPTAAKQTQKKNTNITLAGQNAPAKTKLTKESLGKSASSTSLTKKSDSPPSTAHSSRSSALDEEPMEGDFSSQGFQTVKEKKKNWKPIKFK